MKKIASLLALATLSLPVAARAEVGVQIHIALPAAPPMVVVQPGVQVVENQDEEVFFTNGWYWVRRDEVWYRARRPHTAFVYVESRRVPVTLVGMEPGHYRRFHRDHDRGEHRGWHKEHDRGHGHGHGHHDRHHD
ncbi:MAG: hypothetical protein ACJ79V_04010 [Myxococcales bacterium]